MTFLHTFPLPVTIAVVVVGLAICFAGWQGARKHGRRANLPWGLRALMVVLLGAIGLTPGTVSHVERVTSNLAVYFIVDATGSMAAQDYNGDESRVEGVRHDIIALSTALPGARYSIVEFSSISTQELPLTTDLRAVHSWADTYDREYTDYSKGSSVNRPVERVQELLTKAEENRPEDRRVLFYFGDGESTNAADATRTEEPDFSGWADYVDEGAILGYGTEEGGVMQYNRTYADNIGSDLIEDPATREPAKSMIDEANLKMIAEQIGVDYYHRTEPSDVGEIVAGIEADSQELVEGGREIHTAAIWPFAIALTLLLAWEVIRIVPRIRAASSLDKLMPRQGWYG